MLQDHFGPLDFGVQARKFTQCANRSFHKERHDAETDAVFLPEVFLPSRAQFHDFRHVNFVERRQHRCIVLRFHQTAGDGQTPARHPHAFFHPWAGTCRRRDKLRRGFWRGLRGDGFLFRKLCRCSFRRAALDEVFNIALADASGGIAGPDF